MGSPQQQPARTPEEVGQELACYALLLAGESGKDILRLLNVKWVPWGKSRRRHVRVFLEVLAFCAWLCQHTSEEPRLLEAFYSDLDTRIPPEWKSLLVCAAPVRGFREFLIHRRFQYEEARKLGPDSLLEWAGILTRDVPDLKVEPMALLKLSAMMSAMFTAHLRSIGEIARQAQTASAQRHDDEPQVAHQVRDPDTLASELTDEAAPKLVDLARNLADRLTASSPRLQGVELLTLAGEFLFLLLHVCDRKLFEAVGPQKRELFMNYFVPRATIEFVNRFFPPQASGEAFSLLMSRFLEQNGEYGKSRFVVGAGDTVLSRFATGVASLAGQSATSELATDAYGMALNAVEEVENLILSSATRLM